jgi:hypothetical protein
MQNGKHVCCIGLGNIGSHIVPHLARMPGVDRVTLIDRDVYEPQNLVGQDITTAEVGEPKARVQSRRIQRIAPELVVEAVVDAVENVPLGVMNCDVIVAGLDSKRARQVVNERAWEMGVPWVDGGVEADGLLARATVYRPGAENACLECGWGPREYETIEQQYPCGGGSAGAPATRAPSALGGLAASLVALDAQLLLAGARDLKDGGHSTRGHSTLLDARHRRYYATKLVFNPKCLMPGHCGATEAEVEECRDDTSLSTVLDGAQGLRVVGQSFATALTCSRCGDRREEYRLNASLRSRPAAACGRCGGEMVASGFDTAEELHSKDLPAAVLSSTLRDLGIRHRDWIRAGGPDGVSRHLEVVDERQRSTEPMYATHPRKERCQR